jgi:C_GCAxxG_C_C family probable redox protein
MVDPPEEALNLFQKGFNCAQSVLGSLGPAAGLDQETCLKVAGSFGGGLARRGDTCGAVTGGLMALGLRHAMVKAGDDEAKKKNYVEARKFMEEFKKLHGSLICRELLGCDISTPEGSKTAADRKLTTTLCPQLVRTAVEILEK